MSLILTSRRIFSQVLLSARPASCLQRSCIHNCQQLNREHDSDSSQSDSEQKRESDEKQDSSTSQEDDTKHKILSAALDFVPVHGWTAEAIAEGAKIQGFPAVSHGMFSRGGGDLMQHFVRQCNMELAERLAVEAKEMEEEDEVEGKPKRKTNAFIRDALETRLRMITPYVDSWPQAMALATLPSNVEDHFKNLSTLIDDIWYYAGDRSTDVSMITLYMDSGPQAMALAALPSNIEDHFKNLSELIDDIWYYAGDRSTDFNWYTKRFSLAVVYKSTELHLVQDESVDFQETWSFVDRRLADVAFFGSFRKNMGDSFTDIEKVASAAFETGRNVVGLNARRR